MKVMSVIRIFAGVAGLVVLGDSGVHAQTEINPDHFDSPNAELFPQPKTTTGSKVEPLRYDAEFTLPYKLQCSGKSLAPLRREHQLRHRQAESEKSKPRDYRSRPQARPQNRP